MIAWLERPRPWWPAAAATAAVLAAASDLCMLRVANALRPELALSLPPPAWLVVGGVLGALTIPLYAIGYAATDSTSWAVRTTGVAVAGLGALGHVATALDIAALQASGSPAPAPMDQALHNPWLGAVMGAATLALALASVAVWRAGAFKGAQVLTLPAVVAAAVTLASAPSPLLWSFVAPTGFNVGHLVFFVAVAARSRGAAHHS